MTLTEIILFNFNRLVHQMKTRGRGQKNCRRQLLSLLCQMQSNVQMSIAEIVFLVSSTACQPIKTLFSRTPPHWKVETDQMTDRGMPLEDMLVATKCCFAVHCQVYNSIQRRCHLRLWILQGFWGPWQSFWSNHCEELDPQKEVLHPCHASQYDSTFLHTWNQAKYVTSLSSAFCFCTP